MIATLAAAWEVSSTNAIPLAALYGVGSAFVPILNAEVFVAAAVAALPDAWWWPIIALSLGQTLGKCILFLAARRGAAWLRRRHAAPDPETPEQAQGVWRRRLARWSQQLLVLLDRRWQAFAVVLLSSSVGIPPLAIVSIVAGTRRMGFVNFAVACGIGRIARFLVLAWPIAATIT